MTVSAALSVRSDFSVGESIFQIDDIVSTAEARGYKSVALCDTMSLHGMVDFSTQCKKKDITPIIGCRLRVVPDPTYRKPSKADRLAGAVEKPNDSFTLKVYLKSERGLQSLIKLLSRAFSSEYFYYVPRTGLQDVLALEDVVVTTGDMHNLFASDCTAVLDALRDRFKDDFYIELPVVDTPLFDRLNHIALTTAAANGDKVVLSYPALYKEAADAPTLEVMKAISANMAMTDPWRSVQHVKDFALDEPSAFVRRAAQAIGRQKRWHGLSGTDALTFLKHGVASIEEIATKAAYRFKKMPVSLPQMAPNEFDALGRLCIQGWQERIRKPVLAYMPDDTLLPVYRERLKYELSVLKKLNFTGYFLLVEDLVTWSKRQGIVVGPGRGSVGGSLVAFLIGITDVDPIRFNLMFERFINPERIDLPDADLDFMSSRRLEVIQYLRDRHGNDRVGAVSNFSTLGPSSAMRDAGRVHGLNGLDMMASKLVPKEHGISLSLGESVAEVPEIERFARERPEIWDHALRLEGAMRAFATHAAGVVVAGAPLTERAVVETRGEMPTVCWDKRIVEDFGLVKMDILGLATLDVLNITRELVRSRHGIDIDLLSLPLEEPDVMDAFGKGSTTGVFQFESSGMKKLLKDLAVGGRLNFEDITAATALYRPGPMDSGLMNDFIAIKQGHRGPHYEHPKMEAQLEDSRGVLVYQESAMRLAVALAGFTGAEADHLRKAMGKKDKVKMAELRDKWVDGCQKHSGMTAGAAEGLFDKVEAFAGYGFNKSHATEYALISYWCLWMRVRYPSEYFAASMSISDEKKLPNLIKDARECGIEVMPPDINISTDKFVIAKPGVIVAPFSAVKGCSEMTAKRIVELRDAFPIKSKADFAKAASIPKSGVNTKVVATLDKVGAFANLEPTTPAPRHPDRRRDQLELLPGIIIDTVKAERAVDTREPFLAAKIKKLAFEYKTCKGCSLAGTPHPVIRMADNVKYMVVTDCPTWQEKVKILDGDAGDILKEVIKDNGLSLGNGYFTTLVKARKAKEDKFLTNESLNGCRKFIETELALIKPPVIVALGSAAIKFFKPDLKGGVGDVVGTVTYDPKLDASIVFGINPAQCTMDPRKVESLDDTFKKVAELLT